MTGPPASGLELGRTAYALRVVQPWRLDGRIVGYVELGEDVRDFLARLGELSGAEYAMVLDKARLDREAWRTAAGSGDGWETRPELVAVETTSDDPTLLAGIGRLADVPAAAAVLGEQRAGNGFRARGLFPIRDAGVVVGAVVVRRDVTSLHAAVDDIRLRVVLLATLLAIALSAFVIFLLESLVFERLARMTRALEGLPERLARGEYGLVDEEGPRRADELGRFETFFEQALRQIGSFVADVRRERPKRRPGERDAP
jgi:methyl-accepting chemotaxis protein